MSDLESLRYPIGRFSPPASNTPQARHERIAILRALPQQLGAAVAGLNDGQLDTLYREGGWTVRQLVHHVADSHTNAYIRCKLALTEDWPTIKPYDEAAWARLPDSALPIQGSLEWLEGLHRRWVVLWESMEENDFERGYNHPESGRQNLAHVLGVYSWHSRHHTAHITSLRSRRGW